MQCYVQGELHCDITIGDDIGAIVGEKSGTPIGGTHCQINYSKKLVHLFYISDAFIRNPHINILTDVC